MSDGEGLPADVDPELWFQCAHHPEAKDYLLAEPWQTFTGRMSAWCETRRLGFRVSKSELPHNLPSATRYWVQGFLTGNVPRQPEGELDDPAVSEWRALAVKFLATGSWTAGSAVHRQWFEDAHALAQIGLALAEVPLPTVEVRIPTDLADEAVAAWLRDDDVAPAYEDRGVSVARSRAGDLALIGLTLQQGGRPERESVVVELSVDLAVAALHAAETLE